MLPLKFELFFYIFLGQLKKEKLRKKKEQRKGRHSSVKVETISLDNDASNPKSIDPGAAPGTASASAASPKAGGAPGVGARLNGIKPIQHSGIAKAAKSVVDGGGKRKEHDAKRDQRG